MVFLRCCKKVFTAALLLIISVCGNSQIINSSCIGSDSLKAVYQDDADRIALQEIFKFNLIYVDSIDIPKENSDTVLSGLLAIYNLMDSPERDSVLDIYNIHTFEDTLLCDIKIFADSTLPWMENLRNNVIPT